MCVADADQSDSCSERRGPGETALPGGVVTEQMIEEEKKMKEEAEKEERRLKEERERVRTIVRLVVCGTWSL